MIDSPALVRSLSDGALVKAGSHDEQAFLNNWQHVLSSVEANRAKRVTLAGVDCEVRRLGYRATPLPARLVSWLMPLHTGSASFHKPRQIVIDADLRVRGRWPRGALKHAKLTLDAVSTETETVTRLPLRVERDSRQFHLTSRFSMDRLFLGRDPHDHSVVLRLRMVLRNAAWETVLTRPSSTRSDYEIAFDSDGKMLVHGGYREGDVAHGGDEPR
jgi:hypothetical protein